MANTKSAKKMGRKILRRTDINRRRRSKIRTMVRAVEYAIEEGDSATAQDAMKKVEPQLRRAGTQGLFHKKMISRKISRLTKRLAQFQKGGGTASTSTPEPAAAPQN